MEHPDDPRPEEGEAPDVPEDVGVEEPGLPLGPDAEDADVDPDDGTDEVGASPRRRRQRPPAPPVPPERLEGAVEALLLASGDVLSVERIRDVLGLHSVVHVREALAAIGRRWKESGAAVEVQEVAGGVRAATRPEYAEYVRRLARREEADRLRPALLETLSIVAYRQPVARVEVERIRGVQCGEALRGLLERRLVKVSGRSDQPGRPLLYGTTQRFLEVFGLASLKDLPEKGRLERL
jgi:segregation and condensation protein B